MPKSTLLIPLSDESTYEYELFNLAIQYLDMSYNKPEKIVIRKKLESDLAKYKTTT